MSATWAQPARPQAIAVRKAKVMAAKILCICYVLVRMNGNAMDATETWVEGGGGLIRRPLATPEERRTLKLAKKGRRRYSALGLGRCYTAARWSGSAQVTDAEWRPISSI
jgi:hypothetical protein